MRITGGLFRNRSILVPQTGSVRPSSGMLRETLFNILQGQIEDAIFLDLFAGSGAVGLEALSRGAAHVYFVERDRKALDILKKNIASLGVEKQTTLLAIDVKRALKRLIATHKQFSIIFADPPYAQCAKEGAFSQALLDQLQGSHLLNPDGSLWIEESSHGPDLDGGKQFFLKRKRPMGRTLLHEFIPQKEEGS